MNWQKLLSYFRPQRTLLVGIVIGGVVVGAFSSWLHQKAKRSRALDRDFQTWNEYVALLAIAEEILKDREEMNIRSMKWQVRMGLHRAKERAQGSKLRSGSIPILGEVKSPILEAHVVTMEKVIARLEKGESSTSVSDHAKEDAIPSD